MLKFFWGSLIFISGLCIPSISIAGEGCAFWLRHQKSDVVLYGYAVQGHYEYIKDVFNCGAKTEDIDRLALLVPAIKNGRIEVTQFFLGQNPDVNKDVYNLERFNILRGSIYNIKLPNSSWVDIAIDIIHRNIAVDHLQEALIYSLRAIPEQLPTLVDAILLAGANPNIKQPDDRLALELVSSWYDWAPFFFQTYRNHLPTAKELQGLSENYEHVAHALLNAGADPNLDGTILFNFYEDWSVDQLKDLLSFGANPNVRVNEWNMTVFERIIRDADEDCLYSRLEKIELLIKAGANPQVFPSRIFQCKKVENLLQNYGRAH